MELSDQHVSIVLTCEAVSCLVFCCETILLPYFGDVYISIVFLGNHFDAINKSLCEVNLCLIMGHHWSTGLGLSQDDYPIGNKVKSSWDIEGAVG